MHPSKLGNWVRGFFCVADGIVLILSFGWLNLNSEVEYSIWQIKAGLDYRKSLRR
jgi:hypothetical protein